MDSRVADGVPRVGGGVRPPDSSASSIAADGIRRVARAALDKADATGAGAAAGEAAARPFLDAFVLAEDADTRARLVEGLGACLTSRPRGFGPAWRTAVDVFARAVVDPDPNVALAAADAALAALVVAVRDACESSGTRTESSGTGSASSSSASSSSAPASLAIEMVRLAADFALVADGRASRAAAAAAPRDGCRRGRKRRGAAAIAHPRGFLRMGRHPRFRRVGTFFGGLDDRGDVWREALGALSAVAAGDRPSPSPASSPASEGPDAPRRSKTRAHRRSPSASADASSGSNPRENVPLRASCAHALDALFGALACFPEGLPSSLWDDAARVAVTPLIDLDARREKMGAATRTWETTAAAAAEWAAIRAERTLVPLCRLLESSRAARRALLAPTLRRLPSSTAARHQDLAAHAISAVAHVAATLAADAGRDPGGADSGADADAELDAAWEGVVVALSAAVASAESETFATRRRRRPGRRGTSGRERSRRDGRGRGGRGGGALRVSRGG